MENMITEENMNILDQFSRFLIVDPEHAKYLLKEYVDQDNPDKKITSVDNKRYRKRFDFDKLEKIFGDFSKATLMLGPLKFKDFLWTGIIESLNSILIFRSDLESEYDKIVKSIDDPIQSDTIISDRDLRHILTLYHAVHLFIGFTAPLLAAACRNIQMSITYFDPKFMQEVNTEKSHLSDFIDSAFTCKHWLECQENKNYQNNDRSILCRGVCVEISCGLLFIKDAITNFMDFVTYARDYVKEL